MRGSTKRRAVERWLTWLSVGLAVAGWAVAFPPEGGMRAGSAAGGGSLARDGDDDRAVPVLVFLPMSARRQAFEMIEQPPTALPTATPTITPSPTDTPAPTDTPTPTATFTPSVTPTPTPLCRALGERVTVSRVSVDPAVVQVEQGRAWGSNRPIMLAALPDGRSKVAWNDTAGNVHVTSLSSDDAEVAMDHLAGKSEVRGFVAHDDGAAVLVGDPDDMWLVRYDDEGRKVWEKQLVGQRPQSQIGSKWIDDWGREGRLAWSGSQYGAYFGHTQLFGANNDKHQGDLFWLFDDQGNKQTGGWDWGCSHSLDVRLAHNGTRFGPVCLSDCYPSKGIHFNYRTREVRSEPSGNCQGRSDAGLGGLVPMRDGFMLSFTSKVGRSSIDVGMVRIGNDGAVGPVVWLTETPGVDESAAHLARYGSGFLAGWVAGTQTRIARLDAGGRLAEPSVVVDARFAARDDWVNFANGDVGWAYAWGDMTELKVVRVKHCTPAP